MERETVIRLARESGFDDPVRFSDDSPYVQKLERFAAAVEAHCVPQWISVDDRLPEPYNPAIKKPQVYLCYCRSKNNIYGGKQMILAYGDFAFYDDLYSPTPHPDADDDGMIKRFGWHYERESEGEYDSLVFDMNEKVTHWMPLPSAPATKEES